VTNVISLDLDPCIFNLSGVNSPSLATKKKVKLIQQDTPLLAAGRGFKNSGFLE
jgi:hypothetical protein